MAQPSYNTTIDPANAPLSRKIAFALITILLMLPAIALADGTGGADDVGATTGKVCTFFQGINGLLNAASIVVVTIAVIFSGYQIAFAHKRIAEVAPALGGGVIIGAAAQVARMVVGGNGDGGPTACTSSSGKTVGLLLDAISAIQHMLPFHA